MYESYFGITEKPFSIAPDPRFVYLSAAHEEALAHLTYGVTEPGGFVLLTGEVGTGKTTLLRTLLQQLPDNVDLALVFNPRLSPLEFVASVCDELHVPVPLGELSLKSLVDALNRHLLESYAAGRRTVLVIDEAQGLSPDVLEQVRLLTNLETTREKLLEIILVGQPELRETLARSDLRQLSQRITARFHLRPLSRQDVKAYVRHRLNVVGADEQLITDPALASLARVSGGIPRLINEVADRAMLGAFAGEEPRVTRRMIRRAAREVLGDPVRARTPWLWPVAALLAVVAVGAAAGWWLYQSGAAKPAMDALLSGSSSSAQRPILVTIQAPSRDTVSAPVADVTGAGIASMPLSNEPVAEVPPFPLPQGSTADSAWDLLFRAWGAHFDPQGGDPCLQATEQGLQCLAGTGGWEDLRDIGRPAVLRLDMPEGEAFATLTRLEGDRVVLAGDAGELIRSTDELDPYWARDYVLLWRPPNAGNGPILQLGDTGVDVLWLRERLAQAGVGDVEPEDDPMLFDPPLEQAVRGFQKSYGLEPDGVVGGQTRLRLNLAAPSSEEPRLREGR